MRPGPDSDVDPRRGAPAIGARADLRHEEDARAARGSERREVGPRVGVGVLDLRTSRSRRAPELPRLDRGADEDRRISDYLLVVAKYTGAVDLVLRGAEGDVFGLRTSAAARAKMQRLLERP